jgi:hypothetical protein
MPLATQVKQKISASNNVLYLNCSGSTNNILNLFHAASSSSICKPGSLTFSRKTIALSFPWMQMKAMTLMYPLLPVPYHIHMAFLPYIRIMMGSYLP